MAIERIYYCDGPDCRHHMQTASATAAPFITVTEGASRSQHFCCWDCILRAAANVPPSETIPLVDS